MFVSSDRSLLPANAAFPFGGTRRRMVPARSPQWVVVWVLRSVVDPDWMPASAAAELVERIPDPAVLRRAHAQLRSVTRHRSTVRQARAIATLNLALDLAAGRRDDGQG